MIPAASPASAAPAAADSVMICGHSVKKINLKVLFSGRFRLRMRRMDWVCRCWSRGFVWSDFWHPDRRHRGSTGCVLPVQVFVRVFLRCSSEFNRGKRSKRSAE
jgi:hypothetical protein